MASWPAGRHSRPNAWQQSSGWTNFARERGHTLLELAISWLISQPNVGSVLTGVTDPYQAETNAAAAGWLLSDVEKTEIDAIVGNETAPT